MPNWIGMAPQSFTWAAKRIRIAGNDLDLIQIPIHIDQFLTGTEDRYQWLSDKQRQKNVLRKQAFQPLLGGSRSPLEITRFSFFHILTSPSDIFTRKPSL